MIYVVGPIAFDTIIYCVNFPEKHAAAPITGLYQVFGGAAGNTAAAFSKFGHDASIISMVGEDFHGSEYATHLKDSGINLSHVKTVKGAYTSRAFMPVDSHGTFESFFYWGATAAFHHLIVPKLKITKKDLIHIATGDPKFNKRLAAAYPGATISFDPGYDVPLYSKEDLEFIFQRVNLLFMNEHEFELILKKVGKKSAKELLSYGLEVVVVTHGSKGSAVFTRKGKTEINAAKAKCIDPTGAGDAYRAGFISAFVKGKPLSDCAKIGSAVAAFAIEQVGAQSGIPTWEQALKRAKEL